MVTFRQSVHRRIVVLLLLQAAWIVSISGLFSTFALIPIQKSIFGHQRQRSYHHHPKQRMMKRLSASTTNNDSFFDMEELRARIRAERQRSILLPSILSGHSQRREPHHPHGTSTKPQVPLDHVYIVSFPETTNEKTTTTTSSLYPQNGGIHSIEHPCGKNVILAFANQKSCDRFVQQLRRQQFFNPMVRWFYAALLVVISSVADAHSISTSKLNISFIFFTSQSRKNEIPQTLKISVEALVEICLNVGVMMELIPDGIDILPPQQDVPQFGVQFQSSSIQEYRQLQQQQEKLNVAYYMLDETDDLDDEGLLFDYKYDSGDTSANATTAFSVFD